MLFLVVVSSISVAVICVKFIEQGDEGDNKQNIKDVYYIEI